MSNSFLVQEISDVSLMLKYLNVMQELYPLLQLEDYESLLQKMIPCGYSQFVVLDNQEVVGVCGCWQATKLWTGPYLELDNFVVLPQYRSKGIGRLVIDFATTKAKDLGITHIVLDAFVTNFEAHKLYYNTGFVPKGYHFVKEIKSEKDKL